MISKQFALLLLPSVALASFSFNDTSLFGSDSFTFNSTNPACATAFAATIDCDILIVNSSISTDDTSGPFPNETTLNNICTKQCLTSLEKWVRGNDGCNTQQLLTAIGAFDTDNSSSTSTDYFSNWTTSDYQQYLISNTYWVRCLTTLSAPPSGESKYCLLHPQTPTENGLTFVYNTSDPNAFCDDECGTQTAYLNAPVNTTYLYNATAMSQNQSTPGGLDDIPTIALSDACPNIDTSKFPKREQDITAADLGMSNSTTGSNSTTSGNGTSGGGKTGAATRSSTSLFMSSIVVLSGIAYLIL